MPELPNEAVLGFHVDHLDGRSVQTLSSQAAYAPFGRLAQDEVALPLRGDSMRGAGPPARNEKRAVHNGCTLEVDR